MPGDVPVPVAAPNASVTCGPTPVAPVPLNVIVWAAIGVPPLSKSTKASGKLVAVLCGYDDFRVENTSNVV